MFFGLRGAVDRSLILSIQILKFYFGGLLVENEKVFNGSCPDRGNRIYLYIHG
jgi:hypothetical protein